MATKIGTRAESAYERANALFRRGRIAEARALCLQALKLQPRYFNALQLQGSLELQSNNPQGAIEAFGKAILISARSAAVYHQQGNAFLALRRFGEAIDSYDRAIAIKPDYSESYNNRGNAAYGLRRYEAAIADYDRALLLRADYADAHINRGNALRDLGRYEAALASCDSAVALEPNRAEAYSNRANALFDLERYQAAIADCDRAIALKPEFPDPHFNRGNALLKLKLNDAALASYERTIACKPDHAEAHFNCGNALVELQRFEEAIARYDTAIALKPNYVKAHCNRGSALFELKLYEAAVQSCDRAIALDSGCADAWYTRGNALFALGRFAVAIASYDTALALKPDFKGLYGVRRHGRMRICEWSNFDEEGAELATRIERGEAASPPFHLLALSGSARLQRQAAETWVREQCPADPSLGAIPWAAPHEKIRVGYFSADFRHHAVSLLAAELFETHDRSRFEITAFAFGPPSEDAMRSRLERAFDRFIDVRDRSDRQIALLARELHIDIAVDLSGFTRHCRPGIFALRAAPLQVSFLGYTGTLGASYMDYLVADPTVVPESSQAHYREKIIYLPDSFQVNGTQRGMGTTAFARSELGLPSSGFVFCCFNNSYKIAPGTFDGWMRILSRVEGSVLWLLEDNPQISWNLRQAAQRRQVRGERLVFAPRMPLAEHLARHRAADLFLDTLPFNAHTTASDALWAGLPVLTQLGETFAGRVAGSLLAAIDLPDLITSTPVEYEALAVELAIDPDRLAHLRERLVQNRETTALFDTHRYARNLETAYARIQARSHAGLPPEHCWVAHEAGPDGA